LVHTGPTVIILLNAFLGGPLEMSTTIVKMIIAADTTVRKNDEDLKVNY